MSKQSLQPCVEDLSKISGGLTDGLTDQQRKYLKDMRKNEASDEEISKLRQEYLKTKGVIEHGKI